MQDRPLETRIYYDVNGRLEKDRIPWVEQSFLGIIERLKDQFGDYNDPCTYNWAQHRQLD